MHLLDGLKMLVSKWFKPEAQVSDVHFQIQHLQKKGTQEAEFNIRPF